MHITQKYLLREFFYQSCFIFFDNLLINSSGKQFLAMLKIRPIMPGAFQVPISCAKS